MIAHIIVLCCFLLLLSSCVGKKSGQGDYANNTKTRTKATQKPYTVFGKRYEPIPTHERFVQTGVASWYGRDFHGKKTSNGEIYDMHAMTAAHKTLPLGVFVKVRNQKTGEEAVVRVNDRGPFVKGRIIDLSYAAAKKLSVDLAGTAFVRVEALGYRPDGGDSGVGPSTYESGHFTVQVGSFKDRSNAERFSGEMKKQHGYSEVRPTDVRGELFYRVYAGSYSSLTAAEAAENEFVATGYPGSFAVSLD